MARIKTPLLKRIKNFSKTIYHKIRRSWYEFRHTTEKNQSLIDREANMMRMRFFMFKQNIGKGITPRIINNYNNIDYDYYKPLASCDPKTDRVKLIFKEHGNCLPPAKVNHNGKIGSFSYIELIYYKEVKSWVDIELGHLESSKKQLINHPESLYCNYSFNEVTDECRERPYKLYMSGCDDSSFTRVFESSLEPLLLMEFIQSQGEELDAYVFTKAFGFEFTN